MKKKKERDNFVTYIPEILHIYDICMKNSQIKKKYIKIHKRLFVLYLQLLMIKYGECGIEKQFISYSFDQLKRSYYYI